MKRILIVDDEDILTKTFSLLLKKNGYETKAINNGEKALALIEKQKFDLIICDIRMPGINGVEIVKSMQNSNEAFNKNVTTPVIFISGYADIKTEETAQSLKPAAYIQKPFEMLELLETIRNVVGGN